MSVVKQVEFISFNEEATLKPEAGREYLVVLKSFGTYTSTQTARYMHCHFEDIDSEYLGFAQFQGTERERDQMEVYGLSSNKFKLLDNVLGWAELPFVESNELLMDCEV